MDISVEMIKRIISSDELCDKVNSSDYKTIFISQIQSYILSLLNDESFNIECINRFLKKFVIGNGTKEDAFFNSVLLKLYSKNVNDSEFNSILNSFGFFEIKELLMKKYDQLIFDNCSVSDIELVRMLSFFCYVCSDYVLPNNYIDFFIYNFVSRNLSLSNDLIIYFYKSFALCFSKEKNLNVVFEISSRVSNYDPYYDNKRNKVILYKQNIRDFIDSNNLSDIFYQIKYMYLLKSINDPNNNSYSFDQLRLVKEICLNVILGEEFFDKNYSDISFSYELRKQSKYVTKRYYERLGLNMEMVDDVSFDLNDEIDDNSERVFSVDILFDLTLKKENPNLLKSLIRNYPVLACEYRSDKKKSLLSLLLDIYNNRKLLNNFNKDLDWHNMKLGHGEDEIFMPKINRLNNKISVCSSYINVMSMVINNGDMLLDDIVRSISDLITYDTNNEVVKNDIYSILNFVVPKKISKLCCGRNLEYREYLKKRIIKCYLDSMGLVRNNTDMVYFMKLYSSLEECIKVIDID